MASWGAALLFWSASEGGPVVRGIRFEGNSALAAGDIAGVLHSTPGAPWSASLMADDLESILNLYHERGFYRADVRVDTLVFSDDSSRVEITFGVSEGERTPVGEIHLGGNRALGSAELLRVCDTRAGGVFDSRIFEADVDRMLSLYDRIGYPYAAISVAGISIPPESPGSLRIDLSVREGALVSIDEFRIEGNTETKDNVILRETRIRLHDRFDVEKVEAIRSSLKRLGIFSRVDEPQLYTTASGEGGLLIRVAEGQANTFDGIAGYVPPEVSGGDGFLIGSVNVGMRNLFGTGRRFSARWQRESPQTQEIALAYDEPWVLDLPVSLGVAFSQRQQDSTYVRTFVEAKADLSLTDALSLGGFVDREAVIPSAGVAAVPRSRSLSAGMRISYDTRDDPVVPTGGLLCRTSYQFGSKTSGDDNSSLSRIGLDAEFVLATFPHQVVFLGLHGREETNDRPDPSDLYRFGGTNSLRGYRENQFTGTRVAWTNSEYRFLLARRSYAFGFFDTGYSFLPAALRPPASSSLQQVKVGYGIGIQMETALGDIRVGFALGEGDSFAQGKVHVGLRNEF